MPEEINCELFDTLNDILQQFAFQGVYSVEKQLFRKENHKIYTSPCLQMWNLCFITVHYFGIIEISFLLHSRFDNQLLRKLTLNASCKLFSVYGLWFTMNKSIGKCSIVEMNGFLRSECEFSDCVLPKSINNHHSFVVLQLRYVFYQPNPVIVLSKQFFFPVIQNDATV